MNIQKKNSGHILAIVTIIIWGTTFISTKVLLKDFTPIEILFYRFIIGYIVLLFIYPHHLKFNDYKKEIIFALAGLCGVTLYFLFENIALTYTYASNVGVIVAISPFFTAIITRFTFKEEKIETGFIVGFISAIIGIVLIGFNGSFVFKLNPLGDVLAIAASLVWAIYSILMKKITEFEFNIIQCTRRVFFYGLIFILPALAFFDFSFDFSRFKDIYNLSNILYLGVGASAICFATWNYSVGILGAMKTSVYIYLVPVITVIFSAIILDEKITSIGFVGLILTISGLFISQKNKMKQLLK